MLKTSLNHHQQKCYHKCYWSLPSPSIHPQSHCPALWGNNCLEFGVCHLHTYTYTFAIQIYVFYVTFLTFTETVPYCVYFSDTHFFSYIVEINSSSTLFHFHCYIALLYKNISQYSFFSPCSYIFSYFQFVTIVSSTTIKILIQCF